MARKHIFLTIVTMVVLASLLVGCGSTPAEMTPTPDTSIVWSDEFEDGDTGDWEGLGGTKEDDYLVNEGVLSFVSKGGTIIHSSTVFTGTWSFDVFLQEGFGGDTHQIAFIDGTKSQWIKISNFPNTQIWLFGGIEPVYIDFGERLTGWHHFDVTRDEDLVTKVFMDGKFLIENYDDSTIDSEDFYFITCCEGPALDNVVVRNQVIDIQPPSE